MKLKLYFLTALSAIGLLFPASSFAADLSVRLGQPKTPTNQSSLKLTFVALEIGGTDNIAVSCYKKSPSDSDFVKFEDKSLIPGGNTDYCTVDNNILNTIGSYSFKVIANGTKESNVVAVDYNFYGPGTPVSYSKEKLNDCDYKIKFKTADDSRTTKVELYRSDTSSISIDSSHLVASQNINPNTEGSFVNSIPNCGKEYFYAIRAVDNSENVSGITGDSYTTTTVNSSTTTGTTTSPQQALIAGDGSQVSGGSTPPTEVSGTPSEQTGTASTESGTPEVLGTQTSRWSNLKWLSIPLILIAAFFFRKSRKRA